MKEKLRLDLLPVEFDDLALVAMFGARKYSERGWETEELDTEKCLASARRHENDRRRGLLMDHESELHPCLHAAFRNLMVYYHDVKLLKLQDRYNEAKVREIEIRGLR